MKKMYSLFMLCVCAAGAPCSLLALRSECCVYFGLYPVFLCTAALYAAGVVHYIRVLRSLRKPKVYRRKKRTKFPENSYYDYIRRSV